MISFLLVGEWGSKVQMSTGPCIVWKNSLLLVCFSYIIYWMQDKQISRQSGLAELIVNKWHNSTYQIQTIMFPHSFKCFETFSFNCYIWYPIKENNHLWHSNYDKLFYQSLIGFLPEVIFSQLFIFKSLN